MKPKISVVLPVYNIEKYLCECLDSLINQTFKDIEIICINDGSTDNSLSILEEYASEDKRFRIINQKNQGQSVARNRGLAVAQGKFITFIDPDDFFELDALQNMYEKIIENKADLIISHCKAFADNKNCKKQLKKAYNFNKLLAPKVIGLVSVNLDNLEFYIEEILPTVWGKLFSLEFLRKNNIEFINENIVHEDDGFCVKLLASFPKISIINDISVLYRIREKSSISDIYKRKNLKKHEDNMKLALEDAKKFIRGKYEKKMAEKIIKIFCESFKYSRFYYYKFLCFKVCWHKFDKKIELFYLPIFRERIKNQKLVMKFLGIPVFKKDIPILN